VIYYCLFILQLVLPVLCFCSRFLFFLLLLSSPKTTNGKLGNQVWRFSRICTANLILRMKCRESFSGLDADDQVLKGASERDSTTIISASDLAREELVQSRSFGRDDVPCRFALAQSLYQIQLAQGVEVRIGIGFSIGSECRIDQINPRGVGWPDFLEQHAAASGQIHAHHIRRIATEHPNQRRAPVTRHRKDCLVGMDAGNRAGRSLTIHRIQRHRIGEAKHKLTVRSGNEPTYSLGRSDVQCRNQWPAHRCAICGPVPRR